MENRKEIENIVNSLEGLQKASPGDFFFTRVQARLQKAELGLWGRIAYYISKPAVALATLCIICLLNGAALFHQQELSTASVTDQVEQGAADDYNTTLAANSYYDENPEVR